MKKSEAINLILKYLENWESCQLDYNCAEGLLNLLENELLLTPCYLGKKGEYGIEILNGWEPEKRKK